MTIHADQLPASVRKKLGIEDAAKSSRNRKGLGNTADCPGRCANCRERFPNYRRWEAHACAQGTARWMVELEQEAT